MGNITNLTEVAQVLLDACQKGMTRAKQLQIDGFDRFTKTGITHPDELFTSADVESQRIIIENIRHNYPTSEIVAEEQEAHIISTPSFFTIDPIDGTAAFADGEKGWGCTAGYIENNVPVAGAVVSPIHGTGYGAKGHGAFLNGVKITFGEHAPKVIAAPVGPWTSPIVHSALAALEREGFKIIKLRSTVDAMFRLFSGEASIYIGGAEKIWDIAGSAVMISEAGGCAWLYDGGTPPWNRLFFPTLFARTATMSEIALKCLSVGQKPQ